MNAAAEQISTWANSNYLRLNANKTNPIIFGSSHAIEQTKALNLLGVSIGDEVIPFSDEVSLEVVLQNKLSWRMHNPSLTKMSSTDISCTTP